MYNLKLVKYFDLKEKMKTAKVKGILLKYAFYIFCCYRVLEKAKSIIALNKFKDGDFECDDPDICEVLAYYRITRDDTESN